MKTTARLAERIRQRAQPLGDVGDLDPLLERIGDARCVLLGEASHGTSEYYTWRANLSERLIREKGFSFIAVEGDWPDCYEVNRYVVGLSGSAHSAREALGVFRRWPTWMWANEEVAELVEGLRRHNDGLLTRTQYPAILGNAENEKPVTYAEFASLCNDQQPLTAHS